MHRPQILLRLLRMRGARAGPPNNRFGGGRPGTQRQDHLPCGLALSQGEGRAQPLQGLPNPPGHGIHHGAAAHGPVHTLFGTHLPDHAALRFGRRHTRLLHRRSLPGRNRLPGLPQMQRPPAGRADTPSYPAGHGHPRHLRAGQQPVSGQGGAGHNGQAQPRLLRRPGRTELSGHHVGPPPHHRLLARGARHRAAPEKAGAGNHGASGPVRQPGTTVQGTGHRRGNTDRSRLGEGTRHHRRHQGLPKALAQPDQRAGTALRLHARRSAHHRDGDA